MTHLSGVVRNTEDFVGLIERGPLTLRTSSNPKNGTLWRDIVTQDGPFGQGYIGEALEPDALVFVDAINTLVRTGMTPSLLLAALENALGMPPESQHGLIVETYLIASTTHITTAERDLFDDGKTPSQWMVVSLSGDHGWLIHLSDVLPETIPGLSDGLAAVVQNARANGLHYIRFDADGPFIEGAPTYEW
jgi:hypothetical protein